MHRGNVLSLLSVVGMCGLALFSTPCRAATASLGIVNVNTTIIEQITVTLTGGSSVWYSTTFWCNLVGVSTSSQTYTAGHNGPGTFTYPTYDSHGNTTDTVPQWNSLASGTYDCYAIASGGDYVTGKSWQAATTEHNITIP